MSKIVEKKNTERFFKALSPQIVTYLYDQILKVRWISHGKEFFDNIRMIEFQPDYIVLCIKDSDLYFMLFDKTKDIIKIDIPH